MFSKNVVVSVVESAAQNAAIKLHLDRVAGAQRLLDARADAEANVASAEKEVAESRDLYELAVGMKDFNEADIHDAALKTAKMALAAAKTVLAKTPKGDRQMAEAQTGLRAAKTYASAMAQAEQPLRVSIGMRMAA